MVSLAKVINIVAKAETETEEANKSAYRVFILTVKAIACDDI